MGMTAREKQRRMRLAQRAVLPANTAVLIGHRLLCPRGGMESCPKRDADTRYHGHHGAGESSPQQVRPGLTMARLVLRWALRPR